MGNCRNIVSLILGLLVLAGPVASVLAQAAKDAPAEASAVKADTPKVDDTEEKARKRAAAFKRVSDQARQYLVTVATRWQKSEGEYPAEMYEPFYGLTMSFFDDVRQNVDDRISSEIAGMMYDPAKGLIIARDHGRQSKFVESEKAYAADGTAFGVKRHGLCLDMDAAVYKAEKWPGPADPLAWLQGPLEIHGTSLLSASLERAGDGWEITFGGSRGSSGVVRSTDPARANELVTESDGSLVFDSEGQPIGFAPGGRISLVGDRYPWRGADYAAMRMMTWVEFDKLRDDIERRVGAYAHEVRIVYRQPEDGEGDLEFDDEDGEDEESLTRYYYGYAISPKRILVPVKMKKEHIQRFETITVRLGDKDVPATFLGAYQHFGGFLVEMTGATSPGVLGAEDAAAVPDFNRALMTYVHERKFGKRRNTVWYSRLGSYVRGYEDRLWPVLKTAVGSGMLVLDISGKPVGLCLVERFVDKEKRGEVRDWYYEDDEGVRLHSLAGLTEALAKPEEHFDPNLKPTTGQLGQRLVWLGVETQLIDPRLAEMLDRIAGGDKVQQLTRNGQIGQRITYVHRNSPASKIPLVEGDILLSITEEGKVDPIELMPQSSGGWWGHNGTRSSNGTRFNRRNYLTRLLTRLGPGTKVELKYLSGGQEKTQALVLQWSPPDYSSADKYKDEKTGLTVKNLTYDVRAMMKLDDDWTGVIVDKTESGEKADIAQVNGIITAVNGEPLKDVKDYERCIKAIQDNADGGTAVLSLWSMGKSSMVKIEFP